MKVLVVGKNPGLNTLIEIGLQGFQDFRFEVVAVGNTQEALQFLQKEPVELILVNFEGPNSVEFLRMVNTEYPGPDPIRIAFTLKERNIWRECMICVRDYHLADLVVIRFLTNSGVQALIDSVIERIRIAQSQKEQAQQVVPWVERHWKTLENDFGGKHIALWYEQGKVSIVAIAEDGYELDSQLVYWHGQHQTWQVPYILRMSKVSESCLI